MILKLNAKQLRAGKIKLGSLQARLKFWKKKRNEIYLILDNVLDTYNIGSIFRLADAVAAKKVYLCGGTATPPNHRIKKASINTTEWVEWEYAETAQEAISKVRSLVATTPRDDNLPEKSLGKLSSLQIVAIEQSEKSVPYDKFEYKLPLALVVGHESDGVSKDVLELVDHIVEIPMFGVNISLNVMVSLAIVLYQAVEYNQKR